MQAKLTLEVFVENEKDEQTAMEQEREMKKALGIVKKNFSVDAFGVPGFNTEFVSARIEKVGFS